MAVIALDAMGGDFAPRAPVEAAVRFAAEGGNEVVLVGREEEVRAALRRHGATPPGVRVVHAPDHVLMEESAVEALRAKPGASIRVAFEAVARGEAEAVVGAGHSGAMMVAGKMALATLPGIDRPAIATELPHRRGTTVLLDSGANTDCKPHYLVQFAHMGAAYAREVLGHDQPVVALLNHGSEPGKGNALVRRAHALLSEGPLHFAGNLEPKDLFRGRAEVIVCDGFVGNLVLKTAEAAGAHTRLLLRESVARSLWARMTYRVLRGFFVDLARRTDYREVGGSLLLGLQAPAVVCHGSSSARAIGNGLRLAARCVATGLQEGIARGVAAAPEAARRRPRGAAAESRTDPDVEE